MRAHNAAARVAGGVVVGALVAALGVLLVAASLHAVQGNSDGATVVAEGASMRGGNLLLNGWRLSLDSFWAVDVPLYALGVLLAGVRPALMHVVPAAIALGVVLLGAAMAAEGRRGPARLAGIATVVALLGLPSHALSVFLLQGPLHVATVLWCLGAFWLLRPGRRGRPGARWALAVVALAAGMLGDAMALALGVVPVLVVGLLGMLRHRRWRAGAGQVAAAGASVALAVVVRLATVAIGTFEITKSGTLASGAEALTNLRVLPSYLAALLGVGHRFGAGGVPAALGLVHVAGLAAVACGVAAGLVGLAGAARRPGPHLAGRSPLDDLLTVAFVADLVLFVALTHAALSAYARYLTGAVIFGSILAGRLVARQVAAWRRAAAHRAEAGRLRRSLPTAATGAAALVVGAFGASIGYNLAQPLPSKPAAEVARFLTAHRLRQGIGDYWSASVVTVQSRDEVRVRPVIASPSGALESFPRNSKASWYDGSFRFLVYREAQPFGGVDERTATAAFGPPSERFAVDGYLVLVWPHRVTVPLDAAAP